VGKANWRGDSMRRAKVENQREGGYETVYFMTSRRRRKDPRVPSAEGRILVGPDCQRPQRPASVHVRS